MLHRMSKKKCCIYYFLTSSQSVLRFKSNVHLTFIFTFLLSFLRDEREYYRILTSSLESSFVRRGLDTQISNELGKLIVLFNQSEWFMLKSKSLRFSTTFVQVSAINKANISCQSLHLSESQKFISFNESIHHVINLQRFCSFSCKLQL